jgi:hypothetical protein
MSRRGKSTQYFAALGEKGAGRGKILRGAESCDPWPARRSAAPARGLEVRGHPGKAQGAFMVLLPPRVPAGRAGKGFRRCPFWPWWWGGRSGGTFPCSAPGRAWAPRGPRRGEVGQVPGAGRSPSGSRHGRYGPGVGTGGQDESRRVRVGPCGGSRLGSSCGGGRADTAVWGDTQAPGIPPLRPALINRGCGPWPLPRPLSAPPAPRPPGPSWPSPRGAASSWQLTPGETGDAAARQASHSRRRAPSGRQAGSARTHPSPAPPGRKLDPLSPKSLLRDAPTPGKRPRFPLYPPRDARAPRPPSPGILKGSAPVPGNRGSCPWPPRPPGVCGDHRGGDRQRALTPRGLLPGPRERTSPGVEAAPMTSETPWSPSVPPGELGAPARRSTPSPPPVTSLPSLRAGSPAGGAGDGKSGGPPGPPDARDGSSG